jgi:peptidyl-prolyl cis-trans isomerase D
MLLGIMRKHAKSWLIKFLIGIIAIVFIFYFGYSFTAKRGLKIAYVNGDLISGPEYEKTYRDLLDALQKQYKDMWNDNLIKMFDLKNRALEGLIGQKLISQEAKRLGLGVTEEEVQKAIMNYPAFQVNGQFVMTRYQSLLNYNRMKPEDFEASISQDLLEEKLKQFLFAFMEATDQEVLEHYTFANEKIKILFVQFKPDDFKKSVKADKGAIEAFFEDHKENYRVPEKIKLAYVVIDPEAFRTQVKITDLEINEYYEYHIDKFSQPDQVKVRHILFKLDPSATKEEVKRVREKAQKVLEEARQGKDFSALAEEYSEGPTRSKGGDLGYFSRGKMVKAFEDTAFKLKKGEISDLVRTSYGFHIIKVEDIKKAETQTLDEVRDQIVEDLIKTNSAELAHEKSLTLIDQMPYDADLEQYASKHGYKAKYTGFFSQDQSIPDIGGDEKLRQSLFSLDVNNISEVIELEGKFYIFQVIDKKASYLPEMAEVASKVKEDAIADLAAKEAKTAAEAYLAELRDGKSWDELAKERNLEPKETEFFSRREPVPEIGYEISLLETAFSLNAQKRYPDKVFENDKGAFVIRWEAKKGIDQVKYEEEKEKYRFSLTQAKQRLAFEKWLKHLRETAVVKIVTPLT